MSTTFSRTTIASLLLCTLAACGERVTGTIIRVPSHLADGYWYLQTANDSVLPATIASRYIGISLEKSVLDSAQLFVNPDGTYEQRSWMRILINGALDRNDAMVDRGTWTSSGSVFTFTSSVRQRAFTATVAAPGWIATTEPLVFFAGAPTTQGRYRQNRP